MQPQPPLALSQQALLWQAAVVCTHTPTGGVATSHTTTTLSRVACVTGKGQVRVCVGRV